MTIPGYDVYRDRVPGINRTIGAAGNAPQQSIRGYTPLFQKRLYKSPREVALLLDKTLRSGYGVLEAGTVLAVDQNDTDQLVPYTPDTIGTTDVSRVFLMTDCDASDNFYVDMLESYKLAVGDTITLTDSDGTYESEDISAIDRSSYDNKAKITLDASTAATFTVARDANCYVKAADEADGNKRSDAAYILDMEVDTGAGQYAAGGLASVVLSNAILYQDALVGMDSSAITDLGNVSSDGVYYILK